MGERYIEEEHSWVRDGENHLDLDYIEEKIKQENAITGEAGHFLYYQLITCFAKAQRIDMIVSFLMESGVKLLIRDLKGVVNRGVPVRILTGSYLNITQPSALYMLKLEFGDKIDLRFYDNPKKSFHTKAYLFHSDGGGEMLIGSSNISKGALTDSVEWNYRIKEKEHPEDFQTFCSTFERLFQNESIKITEDVLKNYSKHWKKPMVSRQIPIYEEDMHQKENRDSNIAVNNQGANNIVNPRGAQLEALYYLSKTRQEGYDKGLVVAATGIGKTYLAAFDSMSSDTVLFVAHREEILNQAKESFSKVREKGSYGYFYGNRKDTGKTVIFALVQSLGKTEYLNDSYFPRDYFKYIIIDEFHHAVASQYQNILNYFEPEFLLGLTATPDRMDSGDVYALCKDNLVYELRLKEAINKGWLVPFRYFGIYDDTVDYTKITYKSGRYNDKELEQALMLGRRANLILKNYQKYRAERTLGFCSSKAHAYYMAEYFSKHGVPSVAVYSPDGGHGGIAGEHSSDGEECILTDGHSLTVDELNVSGGTKKEYYMERSEAIKQLKAGKIRIIFSVDMFNEGLDIESVELLLFLRPTQSTTIFLQQLGRGLRKCKDKQYVTVLDFIGNYKNVERIPFLLSGETYDAAESYRRKQEDFDFPQDCFVDFDFKVIDIFHLMAKQSCTIKDMIFAEYEKIKSKVGHVPTRTEFMTMMSDSIFQLLKGRGKLNPCNDYLHFLKEHGELLESENFLLEKYEYALIHMIETTSMDKTYKMPLLLAFYNHGDMKDAVSEEDVYQSFYTFYHEASNRVDMLKDKGTSRFEDWTKKQYVSLVVKNPIKFFLSSHPEVFEKREGCLLGIRKEYERVIKMKVVMEQVKDAIDCRTVGYWRRR